MPPAALLAAVRRLGLTARPGLVAVSGGADSVALLFGLRAAGCAVTAGHFHHGIRGREADADAAFVEALATRLGVPFLHGNADVPAAGGNREATARRLRYAWLADAARACGAGWVATGHTRDDQAETVLLNLARGTGLRGLRGVAEELALASEGQAPSHPTPRPPPRSGEGEHDSAGLRPPVVSEPPAVVLFGSPSPLRGGGRGVGLPSARGLAFPPVRLVRPALATARADLRAYLAGLGEPHREDATNADTRFSRARVRAELLPALETFNPAIAPALARLAGQAREFQCEADAVADALLRACELPRAGAVVVFDLATVARLTAADRVLLVRRAWGRERWPADRLDARTLERVAGLFVDGTAGADLPGGVRLVVAGRVARLGPGS